MICYVCTISKVQILSHLLCLNLQLFVLSSILKARLLAFVRLLSVFTCNGS
uniref:Uncharacterized protein n=1 Tax=Setaria italica TaxID=4555 RepID=K3YKS1_SETIT